MNLEPIQAYLADEGFRPQCDAEGYLTLKSEGLHVIIDSEPEDAQFLRLLVPNIWDITSEAELEQALLQANQVTCNTKCAKVFVIESRDTVWASIEMFATAVDAFIAVFPRCLHTVMLAVRDFSDAMRAALSGQANEGALAEGRPAATRPLLH